MTAATAPTPRPTNWRDIAERAGWTGVQAFLAVFVLTDVSSAKAAIVAAGGAVLAIVKNVAAQRLTDLGD